MDVDDIDEVQSNGTRVLNLWDYMTKLDNEKAQCKICSTILSRKNGATSGLRKHLFKVHKIESFGAVAEKPRSKLNQISTEKKTQIDSLLIKCIVQDGRSFDDMRRPGMLKVLKYLAPGKNHEMLYYVYLNFHLAYLPPHRNTVQRRLKRLQSDHKSILIKKLSKVNSIGITCDFWNDKRLYSYMCLTGHFITSKRKFISKILCFSWFHHRHTSTNISMIIKKELKELNIFEKTRSITTDGAANMLKIGESLRDDAKQIWC